MAKGDGRAAAAWLPLPLRERGGVRGTAHEMRRYLGFHGHGHDGGGGGMRGVIFSGFHGRF